MMLCTFYSTDRSDGALISAARRFLADPVHPGKRRSFFPMNK